MSVSPLITLDAYPLEIALKDKNHWAILESSQLFWTLFCQTAIDTSQVATNFRTCLKECSIEIYGTEHVINAVQSSIDLIRNMLFRKFKQGMPLILLPITRDSSACTFIKEGSGDAVRDLSSSLLGPLSPHKILTRFFDGFIRKHLSELSRSLDATCSPIPIQASVIFKKNRAPEKIVVQALQIAWPQPSLIETLDLSPLDDLLSCKNYLGVLHNSKLFWLLFCKIYANTKSALPCFTTSLKDRLVLLKGYEHLIQSTKVVVNQIRGFLLRRFDRKQPFVILLITSDQHIFIRECSPVELDDQISELDLRDAPSVKILKSLFRAFIINQIKELCCSLGANCKVTKITRKVVLHSHLPCQEMYLVAFHIGWE